MRKQKTFKVEQFKEWANEQLARTDDFVDEKFKAGICVALSRVLHDTGNYEGFNALYWLEGGCEEWIKAGSVDKFPEKDLFIYGNATSKYKGCHYSRRYY